MYRENSKLWAMLSKSEEEERDHGAERVVHCAMLGDVRVGKTSVVHSYTLHHFSNGYSPTVFDNYPVSVHVAGKKFFISLFDTSGQSDYESIRNYTYQNSDVLLVCFSVCDRQSMFNVVDIWLPEFQRLTKRKLPVLLVGTQVDLRSSAVDAVSTEEFRTLAKMIGADCYIECSAPSRQGLQQLMEHIVYSGLKKKRKDGQRKSQIFSRLFGNLAVSDLLKSCVGKSPHLFEEPCVSRC